MPQRSQVAESAASALNLEIVAYLAQKSRNFVAEDGDSDDGDSSDASGRGILDSVSELEPLQRIESVGMSVGFRLTERLLSREQSLGRNTPLDVIRFAGHQFWRAAFGKAVEKIRHMDCIYFSITDNSFSLLRGFPNLSGREKIITPAVVQSPGHCNAAPGNDAAAELASVLEVPTPDHREVVTYAVGILRGALDALWGGPGPAVRGALSKNGELNLMVDFRPVK